MLYKKTSVVNSIYTGQQLFSYTFNIENITYLLLQNKLP